MRVSVIGGSTATEHERELAEGVGRQLGRRGHDLVCGGLGGVMRAACKGATEADGRTIGILPGDDPAGANRYVEIPVATGVGHARNPMVVLNGDAAVAVDGGPGTFTEIGFAWVYGRPIAGLETHDVPVVEAVDSPAAAVDYVEQEV
jgi:uncharacterized protein (TIGR00725 family)